MPLAPSPGSVTPGDGLPLAELAAYLDELLAVGAVRDYGPNGIQVEGRSPVRRVVTGVSACGELFERAAAIGADAVLVHHGLFWEGTPRTLTGVQYRRVAALVRSGTSLLAYHLPLDRHPELGNNALAARALGLVDLASFGQHEGMSIGFSGTFVTPIAAMELVARCRALFGQEPLAFLFGPDPVPSVGIISGGAQRDFHQAIAAGLSAYITGEVSEWVMNVARESGTHYLAVGHHASERLGIRALGEHLAARFGLAVEFVDVPNPV